MTGTLSPARSPERWFTVLDGARLRQLRHQHGLSAAELAGKAGIGLSTLVRLERCSQRPCRTRTRTLARLAVALGQPPAALTLSQPPPHDASPQPVPAPNAANRPARGQEISGRYPPDPPRRPARPSGVTNAVKLARPTPERLGDPGPAHVSIIDVTLRYLPGRLVIEVSDPDPNPPAAADPDLDAESGRGLMLVAALSEKWSYEFPPSGGKTVYCVITVAAEPGRPAGPPVWGA